MGLEQTCGALSLAACPPPPDAMSFQSYYLEDLHGQGNVFSLRTATGLPYLGRAIKCFLFGLGLCLRNNGLLGSGPFLCVLWLLTPGSCPSASEPLAQFLILSSWLPSDCCLWLSPDIYDGENCVLIRHKGYMKFFGFCFFKKEH